MKELLERNTQIINELNSRIDATFETRSRSEADWAQWQRACDEFHSRYDALAFPGGEQNAYERLKAGDIATAEKAIQFLELHPYFFRSQYISTQLVRLLKKLKLPAELQSRFDAILAATRERRARRQSRRTRDI